MIFNFLNIVPPITTTSDNNDTLTAIILLIAGLIIIATIFIIALKTKSKKEQPNSTINEPLPTEILPTPHEIQPIICPVCGNKELFFVPEYHKCITARIIKKILDFCTILLVFIVVLSVLKSNADNIPGLIIAGLFLCLMLELITNAYIFSTESKTHIKAICKDCGKIWKIQ